MLGVVSPHPAVTRLGLQPQRQTEERIYGLPGTPEEAKTASCITGQTTGTADKVAMREQRGTRLPGHECCRGNVRDASALRAAHEHMINEVVLHVPGVPESLRRGHDGSMRRVLVVSVAEGTRAVKAFDRPRWSEALSGSAGAKSAPNSPAPQPDDAARVSRRQITVTPTSPGASGPSGSLTRSTSAKPSRRATAPLAELASS